MERQRKTARKVKMCLRLTPEAIRLVDDLAREHGMTKTDVCEQAIREYAALLTWRREREQSLRHLPREET